MYCGSRRAGDNTARFVHSFIEILAATLHYLNYVLTAIAIGLCIRLFRVHRNRGWLVLAAAFLAPFAAAILRLAHGGSLTTYRSIQMGADGIAVVTYRLEFPGFYALVVIGLLLLVRDPKRK
jgi:hypothetical protein